MANDRTAAAGAMGGPAEAADDSGRHASYLVHRDFFYAKLAAGLAALALLVYAVHSPLQGPGGGTWLGYTLGTVSLGLLGWLTWLGVRKRQFATGKGQVRAWLSAHVYLGLLLLLLVMLHAGFHFGWNVHTLAFVLLCGVVLSGLYGVAMYAAVPTRITDNRKELPPRAMLAEIERLDAQALALADKLGPDVHATVVRSVAGVRLGGPWWQQLTGRYGSSRDDRSLKDLAAQRKKLVDKPAASGPNRVDTGAFQRMETVMLMADQLFEASANDKANELKRILDLLTQRKGLVDRLNRDVTLRARQSVWLFVHVPLTVGLLAAVVAHLVAVFYYF